MRVLSITGPSVCDGIGCRIVIWFAGCNHKCEGCHNKWTWDYNKGKDLSDTNFLKDFVKTLKNELDKPYIKGITLSGGDPLDQDDHSLEQLLTLINAIKIDYPNKDIWIYSGDLYENLITHKTKKEILEKCDVLVDGPFILKEKDVTIGFRGSRNQRIINLKESLRKNKVVNYKLNE